MKGIGYVGTVTKRHKSSTAGDSSDEKIRARANWTWKSANLECYLAVRGHHCQLFDWGSKALLTCGQCALANDGPNDEISHVANRLMRHYENHGNLDVDNLSGSFTIVLLDGEAARVLLYRNLVGSNVTLYAATGNVLAFASNMTYLLQSNVIRPELNEDALPSFFLNRHVPGRSTLYRDCYRLLPGEQIDARPDGVVRQQIKTFRDHVATNRDPSLNAGLIDDTLRDVLSQCARQRKCVANLLSGGVDSSILQAHWNTVRPTKSTPPLSFCIDVDHPRLRLDREYSQSASLILGTEHVLTPTNRLIGEYLQDTISCIGEPPSHVQTSYFGELAETMASYGITTGLCGEGADSQFGLGHAVWLQNARLLRSILPLRPLRSLGSLAATMMGRKRWAQYFDLSNHLHDLTRRDHPVNQTVVFTHWPSVEQCFGRAAVNKVIEQRHGLLDHYEVAPGLMNRFHGAAFLGSSVFAAGQTSTLFSSKGLDLVCPFLDSRMLKNASSIPWSQRFPFRRPKHLLKTCLARKASPALAYRKKLAFGQPIFEWLGRNGPLAPLVDAIDDYSFVPRHVLEHCRAEPNWFLFSLLCFDLWYKSFIRRSSTALPTQSFFSNDGERRNVGAHVLVS